MRILHTSDWHLGHAFHDRSRAAEQSHFLDWLLATVDEHAVDVLVVAGDVFDTANPPGEAQAMYYRFLARLGVSSAQTRGGGPRTVIVVGGNHDSPTRLDAPRDVLAALRVRVVGGYEPARSGPQEDPSGSLVPVTDADGNVGLVVAAVPFLNDWRIGVRGLEASAKEQLASMHEAFAGAYTRLADKAASLWPGVPLIATGHLTCLPKAGAQLSSDDAVPLEINRVGTLGAMGPSVFDDRFRYVALGHIHRGFAVDAATSANPRVWYSGTPVQVSAVEGPDTRNVLLVDVDADGARVQPLRVPCTRRLVPIVGTLDEVTDALRRLTVPAGELPPYVTAQVSLDAPDGRAEERVLEAAKQNAACGPIVVQVHATIVRKGGSVAASFLPTDDRPLEPEDAFLFAWRATHGAESAPPEPVLSRFRLLLEGPSNTETAR